MLRRRGVSYQKRVEEVNRIYDHYARLGYTNREIWRRYVYPVWAISERTFYNLLSASMNEDKVLKKTDEVRQLLLFKEEDF